VHPLPLHDEAWEQMSLAQQRFALETCQSRAFGDMDGTWWGAFGTPEFNAWRGRGFTAARYTHKTGIGDLYDRLWCARRFAPLGTCLARG
jgi:hypothetical protein